MRERVWRVAGTERGRAGDRGLHRGPRSGALREAVAASRAVRSQAVGMPGGLGAEGTSGGGCSLSLGGRCISSEAASARVTLPYSKAVTTVVIGISMPWVRARSRIASALLTPPVVCRVSAAASHLSSPWRVLSNFFMISVACSASPPSGAVSTTRVPYSNSAHDLRGPARSRCRCRTSGRYLGVRGGHHACGAPTPGDDRPAPMANGATPEHARPPVPRPKQVMPPRLRPSAAWAGAGR